MMAQPTNKARKAIAEISIRGKNITANLQPYLLSATFNDRTSTEVDEITIELDDRDELFVDKGMPITGDKLEVVFVAKNWNMDGADQRLKCGSFEIDLVTESGPPNKIEIKAVSTFNSPIRRQLNSKKWEKTTFRTICEYYANKHGLKLNFIPAPIKQNGQVVADDSEDIEIESIDQRDETDLVFLSKIVEDNDYMLKIDATTLTVCSQEYLESKVPVLVISKDEISNRQSSRQAFDLYKEAVATYYDPNKKKHIKSKVKADDALYEFNAPWMAANSQPKNSKRSKAKPKIPTSTVRYTEQANIYGGGKVLVIRQKFNSIAAAETCAKARLAKKNRGEWVVRGEVMGNPLLRAGVNIEIVDYGKFDGWYQVETTTHKIGGGYRTSFVAHRAHLKED